MDPLLVVKMGGSLIGQAKEIITVIQESHRPILVVPGGGPFADMVRSYNLPDDTAHWMAIAAMDQFGWYIASLGLEPCNSLILQKRHQVLLPYCLMRERDPLPHTWEVSSDTIAAWIASEMGAELAVLKSVDGICSHGNIIPLLREPVICDEVDPHFLPFVLSHRIPCTILNGSDPTRLSAFLRGLQVTATRVDTRF